MTLPIQLPDFEGRAACAETDPEAFFPDVGGSSARAKRVCRVCEIEAPCLQWALKNKERFGVWGGMTPEERARLSRQRKVRPISHGTPGGYVTHKRRGEKPCVACLAANALKSREWLASRTESTTQEKSA